MSTPATVVPVKPVLHTQVFVVEFKIWPIEVQTTSSAQTSTPPIVVPEKPFAVSQTQVLLVGLRTCPRAVHKISEVQVRTPAVVFAVKPVLHTQVLLVGSRT